MSYLFERADRRRRDLGNLEKATSDILVTAGVIEDDSLIEKITMAWHANAGVEIIVHEWLLGEDSPSC